jgi:hypothetical protein
MSERGRARRWHGRRANAFYIALSTTITSAARETVAPLAEVATCCAGERLFVRLLHNRTDPASRDSNFGRASSHSGMLSCFL